ncbi:MAG: ribosome small subunit-dependent GTPase A [Cyanobacteriota bacterium]|nr:ribosome small subunit-dependent GTPase A [Cyanobacteriota bacterium]
MSDPQAGVGAAAWGLVVALQANYCQVVLDAAGPHGAISLLCTRRSRLGNAGEQVWVGDRVRVEAIDRHAGRGVVAACEPRRCLLQRPPVANVARVLVVVALRQPEIDPLQLTRFLLTAEATGCPVLLVMAKADLLTEAERLAWPRRLAGWGYPPLLVSSHSGYGLEALRRVLVAEAGIQVICGPSGVGKSSLINGLLPDLQLRVGAVSGRLQRGRHTTRHVELFALGGGALLADSPGFNRPDLPADPAALGALFPEVRAALAAGGCRFRDCRHRGEPGCRLGSHWDRQALYARCLEEVEAQATAAAAPPPGQRRRQQASRRRQRQALTDAVSPPDPED